MSDEIKPNSRKKMGVFFHNRTQVIMVDVETLNGQRALVMETDDGFYVLDIRQRGDILFNFQYAFSQGVDGLLKTVMTTTDKK